MSTSPTSQVISTGTVPAARSMRRADGSLLGRLNAEWDHLSASPQTAVTVAGWAARDAALAGVATLADVEIAVAGGSRDDADRVLLALLRLGQAGDQLAVRTVVQLMLGKAVRIAASRAGRAPQAELEHAAITSLWTVVVTYPVDRRPSKVAANLAMDTLHHTVAELAHQRHETPVDPHLLHPASQPMGEPASEGPADLELLNLVAWAIDTGAIAAVDAQLLLDVYVPGPGRPGGKAGADRYGVSWPAARQRCSRAARKIAKAVEADRAS